MSQGMNLILCDSSEVHTSSIIPAVTDCYYGGPITITSTLLKQKSRYISYYTISCMYNMYYEFSEFLAGHANLMNHQQRAICVLL